MKTDPRVDAYIAKAAPFAQPLLSEMRRRIHQAVPEASETIKWNVPFYELNGKLIASMAAFKKHTKFGVWHGMSPEMVDAASPAELPSAAEYAKKLKLAAAHASAATAARAPAVKGAAKKTTVAKKGGAKKALANKASATKTPAKKARPE